ncbi:uncharacterized protein LOC133181150 [Saccostrea echinata]|uniref:uncharacterized protein LOC133181150 n=1 Tax=Saccostrea echinata TaxID=191078 RepID=UPI002A7EB58C|nr:uncharacterized protein LOC133181150 [Saccostrea echinata]
MEGRLKAIRAGNRSAVTKLFGRFLDLKENPASEEITEEINIIRKSLALKRQTLHELNDRILDIPSEEDIETEIANTDEYMYELDSAQTIAGFALTNANYETAIDLLKERFGQPQKIINAHMRALIELPSPRNDAISLRNYGDFLESHVRCLECLGQRQEMFGALLIPVIFNKLPSEIGKNIAREYDGDNISLQNLRKAISKEVKILESGQIENSDGFHATAMFLTGASKKQRNVHYSRNQKTRGSTPHVETTEMKSRPCIYCCTENHFPGDCKKVTDVSTRFDILNGRNYVSTAWETTAPQIVNPATGVKSVRKNTTQVYAT